MIIYNNPNETCKKQITKKNKTNKTKQKRKTIKKIPKNGLEIGWNLGRLF